MISVDLLISLNKILPAAQILTDKESLFRYGKDWTGYMPNASVILFPKTTDEVQKIVIWARKNRISLVPSGGRTGLSGAATALNNEAIVSFEKMNRILNFDSFDQTVTCEPGVITQDLQQFAQEKNLFFPVDFASRGSSQIGGNISTNAGGIKVLRYGLMRHWVSSLQVVTGTGEVLHLNRGLVKNATGYDLRQLFIGAEGTLGFITQATIQLTQSPKDLETFLFAVPDLNAVMKIYHHFKTHVTLQAYEMFTQQALNLVSAHTGLKSPLQSAGPYYLVIEIERSHSHNSTNSLDLFSQAMDNGWIMDGAQAQNPQQAREFWRLREDISEATAPFSPYKNDISVRITHVPAFLNEMDQILKKEYPHFELVWFGHIGDGNLHINILKPKNMEKQIFIDECLRVNQILFTMIEHYEGSISAEHGVGLTKKSYLNHTRTEAEIHLMKGIKQVFDPDQIMNPGKIF